MRQENVPRGGANEHQQNRHDTITSQELWSTLGLPGRRRLPHMGYVTQHVCEDAKELKRELAEYCVQIKTWVSALKYTPLYEGLKTASGEELQPTPFNDNDEPPEVDYAILADYVGGTLDSEIETSTVHNNLVFRSWVVAALSIRRFVQILQPEADAMLVNLANAFGVDSTED